MSGPLLQARGLEKSYRRRKVVQGVSFEVAPGEVVGLLGPNGAGKTTSFNMVVGLVQPEAGQVLLYDGKRFTASVEEKAVTDARLRPIWGDRLYRVVLTARERSARGSHRLVVRAAP